MDNSEAIGSNPTKQPKANRLAPTEVQNKDWLFECEDSFLGKQTRPLGNRTEGIQNSCAWCTRGEVEYI